MLKETDLYLEALMTYLSPLGPLLRVLHMSNTDTFCVFEGLLFVLYNILEYATKQLMVTLDDVTDEWITLDCSTNTGTCIIILIHRSYCGAILGCNYKIATAQLIVYISCHNIIGWSLLEL